MVDDTGDCDRDGSCWCMVVMELEMAKFDDICLELRSWRIMLGMGMGMVPVSLWLRR